VAVVRGAADEATGKPIVVGVDGSEPSQAAVGFAFEEAAIRRTSVLAVHTWDDLAAAMCGMGTDYFKDMSARARHELDETLAPWLEKYPEVSAKTWVRSGHPVSTLITASESAQLVVVGSRGRGEFLGMLLGSVGAALIRDAHCPVVVSR
jgi:nucleotide-binding universal stress UspA family protein